MKKLTVKQKRFCEKYVELGNKIEAYRQSYNFGEMKTPAINKCVQELFRNPLVTSYIYQLQNKNEKEFDHTIKDSLKLDFELINRYNHHLFILEDEESDEEMIKIAKRALDFIGIHGFNAAMDRVSKKLGFYEKDNTQKNKVLDFVTSDERKNRITELLSKK